ncbi:MAG: hypothetical protein E7Z79_01345 [Methanobrevibacter thaueri]|uniref:Adhesin-like protein n=1 Tax=Methanobrevibacter thaueri TaxID=190975 RepID=A0A8T3VAS9_9EURY|nr:right-handed parallel beta-helix repeat-containing protein [Methanobrevibacter thaueri]MBE6501067.1 hypothetical protein [Methanobrevibacter thaueri]
MKFNKLFKILLVLIVLLVFLNAVAASDEMDSFGVGAEDGNLAVENNDVSDALKSSDGDVLGDGNSWYVDAGAATGGDGSQSSPYSDLQSALSNCNEGDVIHIMPGTYKGTSNTGLTIGVNNLTIVADEGTPVFDGENTRQIFKITGNNVVLKGLQLTKGKTTNGGALYLDGDNICVDKCTINSNNANNGRGGGIYIAAHEGISIINSKINGNKATYFAAGIYNTGSNTLIANCSFYDSTARNAGGIYSDKKIKIVNSTVSSAKTTIINIYGGGIYLQGARASGSLIDNVRFSSCYSDQGGAIALKDCDNITVNNCEISNCIAISINDVYNGDGAGIWMNGKNNVINNTRMHDNNAPGYGVVYVHDSSENTIINNCSFYRNTADYDGSAIYSIASNVIINNSEFVKNHCSRYGGAICIKYGENDSVLNSKFEGNYAEKGGAIYLGPGAYCKDPKVDNCTFVNNGVFPKPPFDRNMTKGGAIFSLAYNPTITNSNFTHNVGLMGGAIVFEYGHNTLENDTFVGNIAERYGGGAISSTRQGDTINNCTFINNQAKGYGGAIGADYPTITNSKFIGNTAFHGGAICTILANVSNSEFYDNSADDGWYIVAATELIENNNVHPGQDSISLHHTKYMYMTYDSKKGITYVDGYTAFCVEEDADAPKYGVMWEDLRFLQNSLSEEYVGEYLKILMFKYWNDESDYASFRDIINIFTDHDFKSNNNAIVNDVVSLYDSGFRVPTNGALRLNDDGTVEIFNFGEIIVPSSTQNVFVFTVNKTNLTVEKEVLTNPVVIGKQVDFNITVKNTGECNLTSVWINETGFSNGLVYDSFRSPFNWNYDATKNLWILNETLEIGKTAFVILTFNVTDSGIMENNVSVGFSNHTFGNDTVIFPVYIPNMTVEKVSLTPEVTVGMPAFFMIRINNTGECELSNINVTEMNSQGLSYQDFSDTTGKWIFIGTMDKPKWQYNGTLQVGESAEIMVIYNTLKAGTFTNVVAVDNNQTEGSGKNDTVIHEPMLSVVKITMTPKVAVGELTSFLIRVTNTGDCDLEDVYVKELKFDGLVYDHFTSVSGRWSFDGKNKWTYDGILAEGERSQFTVFFKTIKVGNFTNIVVAGSNSTNETTAKNVTETFENKTDNNNTNNTNNSNNKNRKNDTTNTTSNVPEDLKGTDVDLKRATGNPLFALLAVLLILSVSGIRKFKK